MKRVGTGFSRAVTPLFGTMTVQALEEVGDLPTDVQDTPIPDALLSSQPQRKHKRRRHESKETEVLDLENEVIEMKSLHKAKIEELKSRVEKLEEENRSLTKEIKSFTTRVKSLTIKETIMDKEESETGEKIANIDADAEAKGIVFHDMEESTTRTASLKSQAKDKGKAKLVEEPEI
nr:hypothetical protein [Tanacetum cinerariifolium]